MFGRGEAKDLFTETGFEKRYALSVVGSRLVSRLCSRVQLPDEIELPTDRPLMIAANHSSLFDLPACLVLLGNYGLTTRIGVNARFFSNPLAGAFFRNIGCVPFSKDDRETAEAEMIEALITRQTTGIMPEGRITRKADQTNGVGQGRPGVSRIARAAGAAVLPVGFAFSDETWKPGTPLPMPRLGRHTVVANIGSPMWFDTDDHIANANQLMDEIGRLVMLGRQS